MFSEWKATSAAITKPSTTESPSQAAPIKGGVPVYNDATKPAVTKGKTIWPPEKKGQLAAAAAKWLSKIPANRSKTNTPATVAGMLD